MTFERKQTSEILFGVEDIGFEVTKLRNINYINNKTTLTEDVDVTGILTLGQLNSVNGDLTLKSSDEKVLINGAQGIELEPNTGSVEIQGHVSADNITATIGVSIPNNSISIAKTDGLQSALDGKAPINNPNFTGTTKADILQLDNDNTIQLQIGDIQELKISHDSNNATILNDEGNLNIKNESGHINIITSATNKKVYINDVDVLSNITSNTSDDRIKSNETPITDATTTLNKLLPLLYDQYGNIEKTDTPFTNTGLIAQHIYYNAPELRPMVRLNSDENGNDIIPLELPVGDIQTTADIQEEDYETTLHP